MRSKALLISLALVLSLLGLLTMNSTLIGLSVAQVSGQVDSRDVTQTPLSYKSGSNDLSGSLHRSTVAEEDSTLLGDTEPPVVDAFVIADDASVTTDTMVTLTVKATDPPAELSGVEAIKFIEFEYQQGAGSWVPVQESDWVAYETAQAGYSWTLSPIYGFRYIRAWARDYAGNISLDSRTDIINLLPSEQVGSVSEGEVVVYRIWVETGQTLSATLTPKAGDPDLYVWGPAGEIWFSSNAIEIDEVSFEAPNTAMYQIEVHGYTDADYRLTFSTSEESLTAPFLPFESGSKPVPSDAKKTIISEDGMSLTDVKPSLGWNDVDSSIYIYGNGFAEPLTVTLGNFPLEVKAIDPERLSAIVPTGLTPGFYKVTVETALTSITLEAAYKVLEPTEVDDLTSFREWLWTEPAQLRVGYANSRIGLNVQRLGGRQVLDHITVEFQVLNVIDEPVSLGRTNTSPLAPSFVEPTAQTIWQPDQPGRYTICAIIDPDNEVLETDEYNNQICRTITVLDNDNPDITAPVIEQFVIADGAQTTTQVTVTLDVVAEDPFPNPRSGIQAIQFVEYEYLFAASRWVPVERSGWVDYAIAQEDYLWTLIPTSGIRYIRAWALDKAGNISRDSQMNTINFLPSEQLDYVHEDEIAFYRIYVGAGETFTATLTPVAGDPDLYIWGPDGEMSYSNNFTGVDWVEFEASNTGVYQIEVHGYTDAQYRLTFGTTVIPVGSFSPPLDGPKPVPTSARVRLDDIPHDQFIDPPLFFSLYLPLILQEPPPIPPPTPTPTPTPTLTPTPPIINGDFETGEFSNWSVGGELPQEITDEEIYNGQFGALLGNPEWGAGLEPIPAGNAYIEQVVQIPFEQAPELSFSYRLISYDVMEGCDTGRVFDTLDVSINETLIHRDGNPICSTQAQFYDSGWKPSGKLDLSAYRGQSVTLRFEIWNREYDNPPDRFDLYNTWVFIDDITLTATPLCLTTELEPNNSIQQAQNNFLCKNVSIAGALPDGDLYDIYAILVNQPGTLEIALSDIPIGTNYNLSLSDRMGNLIAESVEFDNMPEQIEVSVELGMYYIHVISVAERSSENYTLRWQLK